MSSSAPRSGNNVVPHPAGNRGRLTIPTGEELPVQTFDHGDEEVVLVVLTDVGEAIPADVLDSAQLEYATDRGVIRLQGEATFEDRSLVRFHPEREPEVVQRRAFVRVPAPLRVALSEVDAGQRVYTVDLSGGGMLLTGAPALQIDDLVGFEISLGRDQPPVAGVARVVRVDDDGRRGLRFEELDETLRERLIKYVFECLRATRAKTRGDLL